MSAAAASNLKLTAVTTIVVAKEHIPTHALVIAQ
jgi:hypothetical protein